MKNKSVFVIALTLVAASAAYSQEVDDMYFTAKDRAKVVPAEPVMAANNIADGYSNNSQVTSSQPSSIATVNPTDSYSGRGENPEYSSSNGPQTAQNSQYFSSSYQPTGVNQNLCNCSSSTPYSGNSSNYYGNNSGYGSPYGMSSMYGMNSMYGMGYGGYGMGYPYGMGSMYGMGMGYGMGYGMSYGMSYGMGGMGYGYPYSSIGFSYGMGYGGYGYPMYGYPSYGYGGYAVDANSGYVHGARSSRSSGYNNPVNNYTRPTGTASTSPYTRGGVTNGRTAGGQSQYYQRGWRNNPTTNPSGVGSTSGRTWGNSGYTGGRSSSGNTSSGWGSRSSSSWGGSNTNSGSTSGWGGSRSGSSFNSGSSGFSGGSRSSGSGFSGGGGGGGFSGGGGGGGRGRH